ncbi:Zinc transporter [Coemansia guatemalensis]|uniref:Zinc transporter n=1 Tax=Coemansia guatemalensis TaxID=2761395 RepID=A0A9W8I384_9FUNG|nr:Zinc transporter [Coemansia guatemalensis]
MLGMSRRINVLDSHTVLSAMLAGASGAMTYTSVSVLTGESIENLSKHKGWPVLTRSPGATAAGLFILGAYLNLLLARVVSLITPKDSPIKHACASHPPSPTASHNNEAARTTEADWEHGHDNHSQTIQIEDAPDSCSDHSDEHQPLLLRQQKSDAVNDSGGGARRTNTFPGQPARKHSGVRRVTSDISPSPGVQNCRCEYACTKPGCYTLEHCHITPLYPHLHAHSHDHGDSGSHSLVQSQILSPAQSDLDIHRNGSRASRDGTGAASHLHAEIDMDSESDSNNGGGGDSGLGRRAQTYGYGTDGMSHSEEPAVHLAGPGSSSTSQVSTHHHRLLMHVGLQTAVAIGLHKIPEGLIIYLSRQASPKLGVSVAASLFFHNLPEGMMLALPLFLATGRRHMAFGVAALMGALPPAAGAALGMLVLGDVGHNSAMLSGIFGIAFGITAGMMCMVALNGMLPTARIYDKSGNIVAWFFALGVALMLFGNTALE